MKGLIVLIAIIAFVVGGGWLISVITSPVDKKLNHALGRLYDRIFRS